MFTGLNTHIWCRQCPESPCAGACPAGAIRREASTGAWEVDLALCTGCGTCADACPFNAIFFTTDMKTPVKCNLCGGQPLCAEACMFDAITVIEEKD